MSEFTLLPKPLTDEERKKIIGYCSDILKGVWSSADLTNVSVENCV
jgi:hypothetical protein